MNAEEILSAMSEAEGLYIKLGDWAIAPWENDDGESRFLAQRYTGMRPLLRKDFSLLPAAIEYALKDGKP